MSKFGKAEDDSPERTREHPERADATEQKIADKLGMDSRVDQTSQEDQNSAPSDLSAAGQDEHHRG